MTNEALGLERLLGNLRRRCVPLRSVSVQYADDGFAVALEIDSHLEQTVRALFPRVHEIRNVVEEPVESFWAQFGMTGI